MVGLAGQKLANAGKIGCHNSSNPAIAVVLGLREAQVVSEVDEEFDGDRLTDVIREGVLWYGWYSLKVNTIHTRALEHPKNENKLG
jgi:hypothetical protein